MKQRSKSQIKLGIYAVALMGMGVVGVASGLSVIGAHFPDASQTMIQNMMTIPAVVIIFTTLVVGKLMEKISKKRIAIFGTICFLIGGVGPMFVDNLTTILVLRGVVGVGIGIAQVAMSALTAENFEGEEREQVQGVVQAAQMLGYGAMSICGGYLANINWNLTFCVYFVGVLSLLGLIILVPDKKPEQVSATGEVHKTKMTAAAWGWTVLMFFAFIAVMTFSAYLSFLMTEKAVGSSVFSGYSLALFALAGIVVGMVYGKMAVAVKNKMIAISLILMAISFLIMVVSNNLIVLLFGSFLAGWTLSMFMPAMFLNAGLSVDTWSVPMAISMVTMAQNLGQFACPYILNPMSNALSPDKPNSMAFIISVVLLAVLGVIMLVWGIKKDAQAK